MGVLLGSKPGKGGTGDDNVGLIVGVTVSIVAAIVVVVVAVVIGSFFVWWKQRKVTGSSAMVSFDGDGLGIEEDL